MFTRYDRLTLSLLRILRFQEKHPHLSDYHATASKLIFNIQTRCKVEALIRQTNVLLQSAAIVFGTTSLEIRQGGVFCYAASLQLQESIDTDSKDMVATTEQSNARATEFQNVPEGIKIIPWSRIAPRIESNEDELKSYLSEQKIPFHWAENGEWGVEESEATLLVQSYFQSKATAEIAAMRFGATVPPENKPIEGCLETQVNPVTPKAKKEKSTLEKLPPIKLVGSYSPIKNLLDSARRYLEAVAPDDMPAQSKALDEIVTSNTRGKKHMKLALSGYKPEEMPAEAELVAAFVRLRDRRIKEASKPTPTESNIEETPEELAQN